MKKYLLKLIHFILAGFARRVIKRHQPFIIAVTGSLGKTSTKEAIFRILKDHFGAEVRANFGSLNAEIGIPLTILGYESLPSKLSWPVFLFSAWFRSLTRSFPKYLILELGVEHPGDIKYFGTIIKPDMVVITSLAGAHLLNFHSLAEYQEEKLSAIKIAKKGSKIFINNDDPKLSCLKDREVISVGVDNHQSKYYIENYKVSTRGTDYRIASLGQKISIRSSLLGKQGLYSQLLAFAVGISFGISFLSIKKSLESMKPLPGRMNRLVGIKETTIIDDTYNAVNFDSVKAGLDVLAALKSAGRKVAILGNVNESGDNEKELHSKIGRYTKGKAGFAIFIGPNAKYMFDGYADPQNSLYFDKKEEIISSLAKLIKNNDIIYVKASQNHNFFEEIVKELLKDKSNAKELLVRQSDFWLKKKYND